MSAERMTSGWDDLEREHDEDIQRFIDDNPIHIPPAPQEDYDPHAEERRDAKIAVGIFASIIAVKATREVVKYRKKRKQ